MGYSGKIGALLNAYGYNYSGNKAQKVKCPFCGQKHLLVDDKKGVFKCMNPGCLSGGTAKFAFEFYTSIGKAPKDYADAMKLLDKDLGQERITYAAKVAEINDEITNDVCPIEKRNAVYREMAHLCPLSDSDYKSLMARGYTKEQIQEYGYCSLPVSHYDRIRVARLIQSKGISLDGVPGFCLNKDGDYEVADFGFYYRKKVFHLDNLSDSAIFHFLIPSYDMHGNLQFFQIAWDKRMFGKNVKVNNEVRDFAKYTMFSTPNKKGGGRANSSVGYIGYYEQNDEGTYIPCLEGKKKIALIEGTLKSALYYELNYRREPVLSLVGVNNYKASKTFLMELKKVCPDLEQIDECFDMDKLTNQDVMNGSKELEKICNELGLKYHSRRWDAQYKGIDDFAYAYLRK